MEESKEELTRKLEKLQAELDGYCPICNSCGVDGCCPAERCQHPGIKTEVIKELRENAEELFVENEDLKKQVSELKTKFDLTVNEFWLAKDDCYYWTPAKSAALKSFKEKVSKFEYEHSKGHVAEFGGCPACELLSIVNAFTKN